MRFMAIIATLCSWLMVSTFAFPQSGESFMLAWVLALLISGISLASPGRMNLRLLISGLSFFLFWAAILLPDVSTAARVSNGFVGAALFAVSMIPSPLRRKEGEKTPGSAGA
jgi:hypothetical protein